jgi:hypothetical protein
MAKYIFQRIQLYGPLLAEKAAEAGHAGRDAMGEAIRQVYGDQIDPLTKGKIEEAVKRMERDSRS